MQIMRDVSAFRLFLAMALLIVGVAQPMVRAEENAEDRQAIIRFKRMAVAPFLVGRRYPKMDAVMDETLSCPIDRICIEDPTIEPQAGEMMTILLNATLRSRYGQHMIPLAEVRQAHAGLRLDSSRDTPGTLAQNLGRALSADLVMVGTVWRYRERNAIEGVPDMPASVAFAVYLVEVDSGQRLWRGLHDVTQEVATKNIINLGKQLKMGVQWLSADDLARHAVKEALRKFPDRVKPYAVEARP